MKKIRMTLACSVICALLLGTICYSTVNAEGEEEQTQNEHVSSGNFAAPSNEHYTMKVAENAGFELMANEDGNIAVLDKKSGHLYESNPQEKDPKAIGINMTNLKSQIYITFADMSGNVSTKNSQTECVNKGWLTYSPTENGGIRFLYDFQGSGFEIPVEYHLNEKGLVASIVVSDIVEQKDGKELYLTNVALLPFFGAAGMESEGYMLVPDGSGALIYLNNDKATYGAYSQAIYGRDTALITEKLSAESETARIPVFGMKDGNDGFLAIVTEGDTSATVNVLTSGTLNSYNNVYASFCYRPFTRTTFLQGNTYASNGMGGDTVISLAISPVVPKLDTYSIEYVLMSEEDLDYVDMAVVYRNYLKETYGLSAKESAKTSPFYVNLLGGLEVEKYILGIKTNTLSPLTTFSQAQELLCQLKEAGIDDFAVKYTGWQKGGLESKIPTDISFERKLGGKSGYSELIEFAEQNGIELFMDFDFVNLYEGGNGISLYSDAAQTVGSTPAYQYTYNYNLLTKNDKERWEILSPSKMAKAVNSMLEEKEKLKGAGLALSTLGSNIYSDFTHKKEGIDRADVRTIWEEIFAECSNQFGQIMVDSGNAYTFPYVSHIYDVPLNSSGYDIEDEAIPFYQIVLHGMLSYSTEPVNLSATPENLMLKAAETGSSLSACLMYAGNETLIDTKYNYIYSGNYETWVTTLASYYKKTNGFLKLVAGAEITGHKKLQEDVYRTTFSNGVAVYVNYLDREVTADGITVPAKDFVYKEGVAE